MALKKKKAKVKVNSRLKSILVLSTETTTSLPNPLQPCLTVSESESQESTAVMRNSWIKSSECLDGPKAPVVKKNSAS